MYWINFQNILARQISSKYWNNFFVIDLLHYNYSGLEITKFGP